MADNQQVTTRQDTPVAQFQAQLASRANEIAAVLPGHITPEKFQRTVATAVANDPDLLKADRGSLILTCYKAAQDGLLPDKREAALVVFTQNYKDGNDRKKRKLVQYMPMVYGLRKKILQSSEVTALEVGVVYRRELEENRFYYNVGVEPPLGHKPSFDLTLEDTHDDQIVAAYSIATMKDGSKSYEVMRRFEIDKVRECSQTGAKFDKKGKPRTPSGPWVEWFPEQAKKTVMRRHSKVLPQSGDIIIDVEGQELERGMSTARMLGSTQPDAPIAVEDQTGTYQGEDDDTIDASTGEVLEHGDDEGNGGEASSATGAENEPETSTNADDDDQGDDDHPGHAIAEKLIIQFSEQTTVPALRKLYEGATFDIAAMLEGDAQAVETAYDRNLKRLGTDRAKVAQAAKQTEPAQ